MKVFQTFFITFVLSLLPLAAQTPGAVQLRLLDCEMDYAGLTASGAGLENPKVKSLKAEIDAIGAMPRVRDVKYWDYVKERKPILESNLARQTAENKGPEDPVAKSIKAQLATLEAIERSKPASTTSTP